MTDRVIVDVKGEGTREFEFAVLEYDGDVPTYADALAAVDLSPHEVSVLVDGRPVPEDQPIDAETMTVLRLIKGG